MQQKVKWAGYLFLEAPGYMFSGLISGRIYDKLGKTSCFSAHILLAIGTACLGISAVLTPFMTSLPLLCLVILFGGCCMGSMEVGTNMLTVWSWKLRFAPYMQLLHFGFGVGAVMVGLVFGSLQVITGDEDEGVKLGFLIFAGFIAIPAISLCILKTPQRENLVNDNDRKELGDEKCLEMENVVTEEESETNTTTKDENGKNEAPYRIVVKFQCIESPKLRDASIAFVMLCGVYLFLYVGGEVAFGGWIASYSLDMGWGDAKESSFLTSAFWLALTFGRLCAVIVSVKCTIISMLLIDMIGSVISMFLLGIAQFFVLNYSFPLWFGQVAMWMCSMSLGFFFASVYPSTMSLPNELGIEVTGKNTGWLVVWSSFGELVLPFLCSVLFEEFSPAALPWFIVVIFILSFLVFAFVLFSAKSPPPKEQTTEQTINQSETSNKPQQL